MYKVVLTHKFKRFLKKIKNSGKYSVLEIKKVIKILVTDKDLSKKFQDHKLRGELSNFRECHIKDDLLLIYRKDKKNLILVLVNIGSHDDLF